MEGAETPAGTVSELAGHGGTVYLIHFDTAYKHARHYLGWAANLRARLEAHRDGHGARLMEVVKDAGITWRVTRTWSGTRDLERAIKDRHNAPRLCPECSPQPQPTAAGRSAAAYARAQVVPDAQSWHQPAAQRQELPSAARTPVPGTSAQPHREPARQIPDRQPVPAPEFLPVPDPRAPVPSVFPGRPAGRETYRDLAEVTENLISGWQAERDAELEIG